MDSKREARQSLYACAWLVLTASLMGCFERSAVALTPSVFAGFEGEVRLGSVEQVDLLMVVDNSGSMKNHQLDWLAQIDDLVATLALGVKDLHVGVISTDLGSGGFVIPGCDNSDVGDDGLLNPIRFGPAMQSHLPCARLGWSRMLLG